MVYVNGKRHLFCVLSLCFLNWWTTVASLCPIRCVCDEDTLTVWCDSAGLDVVPITLNPGLKELHLSNNRIKGIMAAFAVYEELEYLDMTHNQLVSLGKNSFLFQNRLKSLHLKSNMISTLDNFTFIGLSSLQHLHLSENFLTEITSNVFHPLHSLRTLDLSQNRISTLSPSSFHGLKNLEKLLLRDNKLTYVPTAAFLKLPGLHYLDLGLNMFDIIPGNAFHPLKSLQTLVIDRCSIRKMQPGAFRGLESLSALHCEDNELVYLPDESFHDLPHLQELHYGQNRIKDLQPSAFKGLESLHVLVMSGGKELERIEKGAFSENPLLEKIIISHNQNLHHVDPGTFQEVDHLREVSLRANNFVTFRDEMLAWEELDVFDVRDNPLHCNCSMVWLWNLLRSKNFTGTPSEGASRVLCATPSHLSGKLLMDTTVDDLDCYENTRRQIVTGTVAAAGIIIVATVILSIWHRSKHNTVLEKKWKQEGLEQHPETPEDRYPPVRQVVRPTSKISPITEL